MNPRRQSSSTTIAVSQTELNAGRFKHNLPLFALITWAGDFVFVDQALATEPDALHDWRAVV